MQSKPSVVFCHGLWADGSCFSKLIAPLQAEGYECVAAQYGLNSTAEDVEVAKATINRVSGPVVLVGLQHDAAFLPFRQAKRSRAGERSASSRMHDGVPAASQFSEEGGGWCIGLQDESVSTGAGCVWSFEVRS